ncbi:MAG TPA: hypothetical protein VKB57_01235 [Acidimicrobiales bacterium]|nr:hypothetical protein [Acidimicrobiales bacterium]
MLLRRAGGGRRRGGGILAAAAAVAAVVLVLAAIDRVGLFHLPDWFPGGRDDPAARGDVIYEGQRATAASRDFLIDIGDGEAVVSVKAKQNHDRSGWLINGDFQSTNGTSSVADPDDRDVPAKLKVAVDYCADGTVTVGPGRDGADRSISFDLGRVYVCDTTLEHTAANDAAFRQDDTPPAFHGRFVSFVSGAAETAAAAAACPTDQLERFRTPRYLDFVRDRLAERFDLPASAVTVTAPTVGASDADTRAALGRRLDSFLERHDPDHPKVTYKALSVQYLSGKGSAVEDSCYRSPGAKKLADIEDVDLPGRG